MFNIRTAPSILFVVAIAACGNKSPKPEAAVPVEELEEATTDCSSQYQRTEAELVELKHQASKGDADAAFNVAMYYRVSCDKRHTPDELVWMQRAAELGNPEAMYEVIEYYNLQSRINCERADLFTRKFADFDFTGTGWESFQADATQRFLARAKERPCR